MDLVVNHSSDRHAWFQAALQDPFEKYGKYYVFREGKDGKEPNNWRSIFGGSAWEKVPRYDNLYYLHIFTKEQPDLNWENPEVREEVYKNIRWWMEKGLGGFRIDAIINIKKKLPFSDYPADRARRALQHREDAGGGRGDWENSWERWLRSVFHPYDALL
mgnify:CR=1 FL=1